MPNEEHLELLKKGVRAWNAWRRRHHKIRPDLSGADLRGANLSEALLYEADLSGADLSGANLSEASLFQAYLIGTNLSKAYLGDASLSMADLRGANLSEALLYKASLSRANLSGADLRGADLRGANLSEANLGEANLGEADFYEADLSEADLSGADLRGAYLGRALLIETNLNQANLTGCSIYGIAAWSLKLERVEQKNLIITPEDEPTITVDDIELAQFIYLLLHNDKIRRVIDTITSKAVLILGRFTPERKPVLDAIREALRAHGYLPILFDFEKPASHDLTETISTLAHMARFIIADITDAKSIPQELGRIVPGLPSVPVQPLLASSDYEYAMFEHIRRYPWVLPVYLYESQDQLVATLEGKVIVPAEVKAKELAPR